MSLSASSLNGRHRRLCSMLVSLTGKYEPPHPRQSMQHWERTARIAWRLPSVSHIAHPTLSTIAIVSCAIVSVFGCTCKCGYGVCLYRYIYVRDCFAACAGCNPLPQQLCYSEDSNIPPTTQCCNVYLADGSCAIQCPSSSPPSFTDANRTCGT